MFDLAQCAAGVLEDYMRMSKCATETISPLVLAIALELQRLHGSKLAAAYLHDSGIAFEVAVELICATGLVADASKTVALLRPLAARSGQL